VTYLRGLWADVRRVVFGTPDLALIAVFASAAFVLEHYLRLPLRPRPEWRGAIQMVVRSAIFLGLPLLSLPLLRVSPAALGFRVGDWRKWLPDIALLFAIMLPLVIIASRRPEFLRVYPYFAFARAGIQGFLVAQLIRLVGMFSWEFMMRGYLLFGFERRVGSAAAVAVQVIPFAILHFGKPLPETAGSIIAGLALGLVAVRARSFLPCALLHFGVAATLDLFAVLPH
jgi:membrane protease YdiL (CAAX protease family)